MIDATFVTAFFLVREKENHPFKNDKSNKYFCFPEFYYDAMKLLLQQPINLVIFAEPANEKQLWEIRPLNLHYLTRIVVLEYEELSYWGTFPQFTENHSKNPVKNHTPEKFTPLYKFIVNHKTEFVKYVVQMNPFNTTYFGWMDLRLYPVYNIPLHELDRVISKIPSDRVFIHQMAYTSPTDVENRHEFYSATRGQIAAGFWVACAEPMLKFCNLCVSEYRTSLREGYAPSDEMIFAMIVGKNHDLFDPYFGDYGEMLYNTLYVRRNQHLAINYLNISFDRGTHYQTHKCAESLRMGLMTNHFSVDTLTKFNIWYKNYVACFWLNKHDYCKQILFELFDLATSDKDLLHHIKHLQSFIENNIKYLEDENVINRFKLLFH